MALQNIMWLDLMFLGVVMNSFLFVSNVGLRFHTYTVPITIYNTVIATALQI